VSILGVVVGRSGSLFFSFDGIPEHLALVDPPHVWAAYDAALASNAVWAAAIAALTLVVVVGWLAWCRRQDHGGWVAAAGASTWIVSGWLSSFGALASAWLRGFDYD